jgi:hypothetical protein
MESAWKPLRQKRCRISRFVTNAQNQPCTIHLLSLLPIAVFNMKLANEGKEKATRQCWECLKRRLVCDFTLPHCKKCQKSGEECPGYNDRKPLQWIANGKVTSQHRNTKTKLKPRGTTSEEAHILIPELGADVSGPSALGVPDTSDSYLGANHFHAAFDCWNSIDESTTMFMLKDHDEKFVREYVIRTAAGIEMLRKLFAVGGRRKIEEVVAKGLQSEAAKLVQPSDQNPINALERVLTLMRMYDLPDYGYLFNSTSEVVQAVTYCMPFAL